MPVIEIKVWKFWKKAMSIQTPELHPESPSIITLGETTLIPQWFWIFLGLQGSSQITWCVVKLRDEYVLVPSVLLRDQQINKCIYRREHFRNGDISSELMKKYMTFAGSNSHLWSEISKFLEPLTPSPLPQRSTLWLLGLFGILLPEISSGSQVVYLQWRRWHTFSLPNEAVAFRRTPTAKSSPKDDRSRWHFWRCVAAPTARAKPVGLLWVQRINWEGFPSWSAERCSPGHVFIHWYIWTYRLLPNGNNKLTGLHYRVLVGRDFSWEFSRGARCRAIDLCSKIRCSHQDCNCATAWVWWSP